MSYEDDARNATMPAGEILSWLESRLHSLFTIELTTFDGELVQARCYDDLRRAPVIGQANTLLEALQWMIGEQERYERRDSGQLERACAELLEVCDHIVDEATPTKGGPRPWQTKAELVSAMQELRVTLRQRNEELPSGKGLKAWKLVSCPHCGASKGERCRWINTPVNLCHRSRNDEASKVATEIT